ncbi:MAG: D-2-hydroxyacid dehydrogenase [Halobacteriales archaeon]|nr:D-2-hydroxyacid dehydrogenase [Halobacteriales archaeon]
MGDSPSVLLLHGFPPENRGGPAELETAIRSRLSEIELDRSRDHEDAIERIATADIVIEHGYGRELFEHGTHLQWIQSLSAGYDRYDLDFLETQNITLTTVSGVHANPIAEHVIGSLLAFEHGLDRAMRQQQRGEWQRWTPRELAGKTMGIIGVGAIGGRIAELASAHDLTVIGTKRDPTTGADPVDEIYGPEETHTVLGRADYVVIACPLTDATRGLIDREAFASMSRDAVFVNIARGEITDQAALVEMLQRGQIRGAVLDVFEEEPLPSESPLWSLSNVLLTPHLAGGSPRYVDRVADIFAANYRHYIDGEESLMQNRVV